MAEVGGGVGGVVAGAGAVVVGSVVVSGVVVSGVVVVGAVVVGGEVVDVGRSSLVPSTLVGGSPAPSSGVNQKNRITITRKAMETTVTQSPVRLRRRDPRGVRMSPSLTRRSPKRCSPT